MNRLHHWYCARPAWSTYVREDLVPGSIDNVDLGDDVLELGAGPGMTTDVLVGATNRLTVLEIDPGFASALRQRLGTKDVEVHRGDAAHMPFEDDRFSAVVCFTMLHHVPTPAQQDRIFAEARRVLRPGGVFLGSDSLGGGLWFWVLHLGDTKTLVDPRTLPDRLRSAGFTAVDVEADDRLLFRAVTAA